MAIVAKPKLSEIWASQGGIAVPTLDQIMSGWRQNQFPPSEMQNYLQRQVETAIQYIFQVGVPAWDADTEYQQYALARDGGIFYLASVANKGKRPSGSQVEWKIAFDSFGASDDLRAAIAKIQNEEGFLKLYVSKAKPVMTGAATAPSLTLNAGATSGLKFSATTSTITSVGNEILFTAGGVVNGRIKPTKPTLAMNDSTLVTTELLKQVMDEVIAQTKKASQLPIGYSVATNFRKPPSEPDQLGYGVWELDCQGRALVGVSADTTITTPDWTKDANSKVGEYEHTMTLAELVPHEHYMDGRWQDGGSGGIQGGNNSDADVAKTKSTGGGKPFNIVQPSQTKFIWTRVG